MLEKLKEKFKLNPKNKKLIIIVACIFVVAVIATTVIIVVLSHRETVGDILDLGDRYMSEMDYESAIREYKRAIEIDPKSEDAYLKLAEAYIAIGDRDSAIETLEDGYEATQSNRILERLNELREELHTPEHAKELSVATEPDKLEYYVGETLDLTGLTFTVTYEDGTTEEISEGYTYDVKTLEESGTVEVTVEYGGAKATVNVTVVENPGTETEPSTTEPSPTEPSPTEPSTTEPSTTEPSPTDPSTIETTETEPPVTDAPVPATLTGISIKTQPTKTTYYVGEKLNTSGLTLTAAYSNGKAETITSGFTCSPTTLNTAGTQKITVTYGGKTATFNVTVKSVSLTGISIKTQPTKTTYYVGEKLNTSGLTLTAAYSDGKAETITSGFTCSPTTLNTAGTQKITVTYGGKTATFNVTVKSVSLTGISIKTQPTKTTYYVGDTLNTSGLTLTAAYSDGKAETITSGFTCSPTTLNTAGTQKITVTYGGKTATFNVTVKEPTLADDFTWTLENGVLTLSGHGLMPNYDEYDEYDPNNNIAPWEERISEIKKVVINDGILNIGDNAFCYCYTLAAITISDSVKSIGRFAFEGCESLTTITIPGSVKSIGDGAFAWCGLTSITIPDSVTSIGYWAFHRCSNLTIHGRAGSYAEQYAKDNDIPFVAD